MIERVLLKDTQSKTASSNGETKLETFSTLSIGIDGMVGGAEHGNRLDCAVRRGGRESSDALPPVDSPGNDTGSFTIELAYRGVTGRRLDLVLKPAENGAETMQHKEPVENHEPAMDVPAGDQLFHLARKLGPPTAGSGKCR